MSFPTREQFVERVTEVVRNKFPLVKVARGQRVFSLKVNGHDASLENLYRLSSLRPDDMRHHIERWMVELIRAGEGRPDQEGRYDAVKHRILPMVLAASARDVEGSKIVTQPLVDGLQVGYAVDNDRTISYIPQSTFQEWKLPINELHDTAVANLITRSEAIAAQAAQDDDGEVNLILFQTMDGYDASRILLPSLHDRLRTHLGSPFAAAIPNRDILLCFRNDDETVDRLKPQITDDFESMPHQVTDRLFLLTPDGIAPR